MPGAVPPHVGAEPPVAERPAEPSQPSTADLKSSADLLKGLVSGLSRTATRFLDLFVPAQAPASNASLSSEEFASLTNIFFFAARPTGPDDKQKKEQLKYPPPEGAITDPNELDRIRGAVEDVAKFGKDGREFDIDAVVSVLAHGIYSDHLITYEKRLREMNGELKPLEEQLKMIAGFIAGDVTHLTADELEALADAVKGRRLNEAMGLMKKVQERIGTESSETDESLNNLKKAVIEGNRAAFNREFVGLKSAVRARYKELIEAAEDITKEIAAINEKYKGPINNAFKMANIEMERQLAAAIAFLEIQFDYRLTDDSGEEVETLTYEDGYMVTDVMENVPIHVDASLTHQSVTLRTLHHLVGDHGLFAEQIRIGVYASFPEIFHEVLHAAPSAIRPQWIIDGEKDLYRILEIVPLEPSFVPANHVTAIKTMGFIEEACAFGAEFYLVSVLNSLNIPFFYDTQGLVTFYGEDEANPIGRSGRGDSTDIETLFDLLRNKSPVYNELELSAALRLEAMSLRNMLAKGLLTNAGVQIGLLEEVRTSAGRTYKFAGDTALVMKAASALDIEGLARTFLLGEQTKRSIEGGLDVLLPVELLELDLTAESEERDDKGDPSKIAAAPNTSRFKIAILAELRRLILSLPQFSLARFEMLLSIAEQSPAEEAPRLFREARDLIERYERVGEHDLANEMLGAFALSLFERGYTGPAKRLVSEFILSTAVPEGMFEAFISGDAKVKTAGVGPEGLKFDAYKRFLIRAAKTKAREFVTGEALRLFDLLTIAYKKNDTEQMGDLWMSHMFAMAAFRDATQELDPDLSRRVAEKIKEGIKTAKPGPDEGEMVAKDAADLPTLFLIKNELGTDKIDDIARLFYAVPDGVTPKEAAAILDGYERIVNELRIQIDTPKELNWPMGVTDYLKGLLSNKPQVDYSPQEEIKPPIKKEVDGYSSGDEIFLFVLGRAFALRSEPILRAKGIELLKRLNENFGSVISTDLVGVYSPETFSPLARAVMAAQMSGVSPDSDKDSRRKSEKTEKVRTLEQLGYVNTDILHALAKIVLAQAEPSNAGKYLKMAERLLSKEAKDVIVRLQNFPRVEALLSAYG